MARGPAKRTTEFALAIASHPMLIAAICRAVADTLPGLVEQIEEEQRQAAVPLTDEPPMTYHERRAAKTAPR